MRPSRLERAIVQEQRLDALRRLCCPRAAALLDEVGHVLFGAACVPFNESEEFELMAFRGSLHQCLVQGTEIDDDGEAHVRERLTVFLARKES